MPRTKGTYYSPSVMEEDNTESTTELVLNIPYSEMPSEEACNNDTLTRTSKVISRNRANTNEHPISVDLKNDKSADCPKSDDINDLFIGGLDLPPISDNEDSDLLEEWRCECDKKRREQLMKKLWEEWEFRHNNSKMKEADGVVSSASGEKEVMTFSSESDGVMPVLSESVGVMPNLSDDGEMSAPIIIEDVEEMSALASSRDNREMSAPIVSRDIREMSAPVASRDSREMSAPTISRDTEEMSALGISEAMWTAALRVRFTSSLKTRKRIIAKALMPQQVLPIVGTLEWRRLDFIVYRERMNARHLMRSSQNALIREEARKEFLRMEEFYKATGCGSYKNARNVRRLRSELL